MAHNGNQIAAAGQRQRDFSKQRTIFISEPHLRQVAPATMVVVWNRRRGR